MWALAGLVWAGSAVYSRFWDHGRTEPSDRTADAYVEAREQYLKGNWFEAECLLSRILKRNPRDLEARLMLATLLRHTGRRDEAARQLDRLERFEGSGKWVLEISRERQQLQAAKSDEEDAKQEAASPPPGADASPQAA
jgi:thioredoxin-like negative regulator of GroEL